MEIRVTIAGKETAFKKSGGTMRRYKSMFGREWFADLDKIARMQRRAAEAAKAEGYDIEKAAETAKKTDKKTVEKKRYNPPSYSCGNAWLCRDNMLG